MLAQVLSSIGREAGATVRLDDIAARVRLLALAVERGEAGTAVNTTRAITGDLTDVLDDPSVCGP